MDHVKVSNDSGEETIPVRDLFGDLRVPALPEGSTPTGLLAFVRLDDKGGTESWSVRVSPDFNDEEVLGLLVGYVEHLKHEASQSWEDPDE